MCNIVGILNNLQTKEDENALSCSRRNEFHSLQKLDCFWTFFFDQSLFLNVRLKSAPLHYSDFHIVSFLTEFIYKSLSGIQAKTNLTSSLWFMISISPSNRAKTLRAIFHWKACSHFFLRNCPVFSFTKQVLLNDIQRKP